MKDPYKRRYLYLMRSIFGAISLSIVVFFALYRFRGIGDTLHRLADILAPFIYGGVVAYLLRPMCNHYERWLRKLLPRKVNRLANSLAVALSLITGLLIVYALIIMMAPQLYQSIMSLWNSLPKKVNDLLIWGRLTFGENELLTTLFNRLYILYSDLESWSQNTLIPYLSNIMGLVSGLSSSVYRVLMFVYNMLIGLIVACYLLASRKKFARQSVLIIRSILQPRWADLLLSEIAFVDRMFGGSFASLFANFLNSDQLSEKTLDELQAMIDEKRNKD